MRKANQPRVASPKVGNGLAREWVSNCSGKCIRSSSWRSWRSTVGVRLITAAGTCEITQATECRWEKASLTLVSCHCTVMMMTHTLQSELSCCLPHAGFDVNFITLPEISCTHITHITHYPSELREHIVQRVLCKVRIRRHISYGGIWHWVDWANRAKPKWLLKIYWIYRQQTNWSWLKVGKTRKNALMHTRPHGQDRYVDN